MWTVNLPDNIVNLQANNFHDKCTGLQDTRLRTNDNSGLIDLFGKVELKIKINESTPLWCLKEE